MANSVRHSSSTGSNLPEEIVSEILEKLPVKSLLRFQIASKTWLTLISNTQFIKSHLRRAPIPTLLTLEWEWEREPGSFQIISMDGEVEHQPDPQLDPIVRHRSEFDSPVRFQRIVMPQVFSYFGAVSCCNGIICLESHMDNRVIYLWNPLLKHYKKLPLPERHHDPVIDSWSWPIQIGFGYDSISNDFKVLRFVSRKENDSDLVVQLYSSNADSWRELTDPILTNWGHSPQTHFVNGVLYLRSGTDFDRHAVSFDLHEEVFGLVLFPSFATNKVSNFLDFEGSVAMAFNCYGDDEFHLCTLDTVSGTWTKIFRLKHYLWLNLYLGAGQFYGDLCEPGGRLCNVLYDYEKKEAYYCQVPISKDKSHIVLKYKESLVSFKGYQEVVYNTK